MSKIDQKMFFQNSEAFANDLKIKVIKFVFLHVNTSFEELHR